VNRNEAIAVLHEIFNVWGEYVSINGASLVHEIPDLADSYAIRVFCCLDDHSRNLIKPVLEKNNLGMKEENGSVIIRSLYLVNQTKSSIVI
jgi:hypothetical protein